LTAGGASGLVQTSIALPDGWDERTKEGLLQLLVVLSTDAPKIAVGELRKRHNDTKV